MPNPSFDTSITALSDAAESTSEFKYIALEPPDSLGEDQFPAFVVHTEHDYEDVTAIDHEFTLYDGYWTFQISLLFDFHDIKERFDVPVSEMNRIRDKFLLQLKNDVTPPGFEMTSLRTYQSYLGASRIRVMLFTLRRHMREDYESSTV